MIHPPEFYKAHIKVCEEDLKCDPWHLLRVEMSESGVSAIAHNDNPKNLPPDQRFNASGLLQFMPATMSGMQFHPELTPASRAAEFRKLSATQQVEYVRRYLLPYRGKLVSTAACYVSTFLPADIDLAGDPEAVLVQKGGRRGWAFDANATFDANHDLKIQVKELDEAIIRNCTGDRWFQIENEFRAVLGLPTVSLPPPKQYVLTTTLGIQQALCKLGFIIACDGIPGKNTLAAITAFQKSVRLVPDGIPGPLTRAALDSGLRSRGLIA